MARQNGKIKLKGNIDGISFYQMEGKDVARMSYGHSRKRINKDPALAAIKANITEFGAAGLAAGSIRMLLAIVLKRIDTGRVQNRLVKVFQEIYKKDHKSAPGKRLVALSQHQHLLEGFEFSSRAAFGEAFRAKIKLEKDAERRGATIEVPIVYGVKEIIFPEGATHFKLGSYQCLVSDYGYHDKLKQYMPAVEVSRQMLVMAETGLLELKEKHKNIRLKTFFKDSLVPGKNVSVVLALYMEFYRYEKGAYLPVKEGRCLRVAAVF